MFRDDAQRVRTCRALLATVRLERLWTSGGPTPEALELLEVDGTPLSAAERVMVLATWALWNGSGGLTVAEVLERLDCAPAEAPCFLVMASTYDVDAIDDWLAEHEHRGGTS